jgi:hypothetical protein
VAWEETASESRAGLELVAGPIKLDPGTGGKTRRMKDVATIRGNASYLSSKRLDRVNYWLGIMYLAYLGLPLSPNYIYY